jgi:hypothetical protein
LIWLGIGIEWLIIAMVVLVDPLQAIFGTAPLAGWQGLLLTLCPLVLLGAEERRKVWLRGLQAQARPPRRAR